MELIASQPNITMPEMAAKTKLTLKAIEKQIALLKEEGLLRREGPTHGGHWVIVTPEHPANNNPTKQH